MFPLGQVHTTGTPASGGRSAFYSICELGQTHESLRFYSSSLQQDRLQGALRVLPRRQVLGTERWPCAFLLLPLSGTLLLDHLSPRPPNPEKKPLRHWVAFTKS